MLRTIGEAARFILTRHRRCTPIGPYAVITVEVRPSRYETRTYWGEEGAEVECFVALRSSGRDAAAISHARVCAEVRSVFAAGADGHPLRGLPPAA